MFQALWRTDNLYELGRGLLIKHANMRGGAALCLRLPNKTVNLRNPLSDVIPIKTPSSIEFRYPPMKADKDHLKLWVELVEIIMQFGKMDAKDYSRRLGHLVNILNNVSPGEETWAVVLGELGLGERVEVWRAHKCGVH